MRYYVVGQLVLARIGDAEWAPGEVIEESRAQWGTRYRVRLDAASEGRHEWCFSPNFLIADTPRNRRNKGVPAARLGGDGEGGGR